MLSYVPPAGRLCHSSRPRNVLPFSQRWSRRCAGPDVALLPTSFRHRPRRIVVVMALALSLPHHSGIVAIALLSSWRWRCRCAGPVAIVAEALSPSRCWRQPSMLSRWTSLPSRRWRCCRCCSCCDGDVVAVAAMSSSWASTRRWCHHQGDIAPVALALLPSL